LATRWPLRRNIRATSRREHEGVTTRLGRQGTRA
jgi:hypothetical protein